MHHLRFLIVILVALTVTTGAFAQRRGQIQEGSPAPGLDIEQWYNSDGVAIEAGKIPSPTLRLLQGSSYEHRHGRAEA